MYASDTDIANAALRHLGVDEISSIDSTTSANARRLKAALTPAARAWLAAHPWDYASEITELASVTNDLSDDWRTAFRRLSTDLYLRTVYNAETGAIVWQSPTFEGVRTMVTVREPIKLKRRTIYANVDRLKADYVAVWDAVTEWPSGIQDPFAWFLAGRVAYQIKGDYQLAREFMQAGMSAKAAAFAHDLSQDDDSIYDVAGHHLARGDDGALYGE